MHARIEAGCCVTLPDAKMSDTRMAKQRTVSLMAGASPEARQSCIQQMLAADPEPGRSLWLRTGDVFSVPPSATPWAAGSTVSAAAGESGGAVDGHAAGMGPDHQMAGGCICCLAGPMFRTTLVRLLRQPRWQHLVLELSESSPIHLLKVIDQLRSPPFDQYLRLRDVIEVRDDGVAEAGPASRSDLLHDRASPSRPVPAVAGVCHPQAIGVEDPAADTAWASVRSCRQAGAWVWRPVDPLAAAWQRRVAPGETILCQRWAADAERPSRQAVQQALMALLATPGITRLDAVLQSHRSAYVWQTPLTETSSLPTGAAEPIGLSGQNLSAVLRSRETVWRLDNRICLGLAQGTDLALLGAALASLKQHWTS